MTKLKELIAHTPEPPYFAVIFTSLLSSEIEGYEDMALKMICLAEKQDGFIGVETARENSSLGVTVSYWKDERSISEWKENIEHQLAQKFGKEKWYQNYMVRIAKVEREYGNNRKNI